MMLTTEQQKGKDTGIEQALSNVPQHITDSALRFIHAYAQINYRFTGTELLEKFKDRYKEKADTGNAKGWRDYWGGVINLALREGFMKPCGTGLTPQKFRHKATGPLYESKVYTLGDEDTFEPSHYDLLKQLFDQYVKVKPVNWWGLVVAVFEASADWHFKLGYDAAKANFEKKRNKVDL